MAGAEPFELGGDPSSIRASASKWGTFATHASGASSRIARMNTAEFVGSEGDQYRQDLNSDMRPHLDRTAEAWFQVQGALNVYANTLERLQRQMASVAATASRQRTTLEHAKTRLEGSKAADFRHQFMNSGDTDTDQQDTYHSHTARYAGEVDNAQQALQGSIDAANRIHAKHDEAVHTCCRVIDDAKGKRFVKPPGFFGRIMHAVGHWVAEHAAVLMKISSVLKTISAVAGLLAMIPVLAPVMGPIAFATGAGALVIDLSVSAATGNWNVRGLVMEGIGLIPGARSVMALKSVSRLGRVGRVMESAAKADKAWDRIDNGVDLAQRASTVYDFSQAKHHGWQDYLGLATTVAGVKAGAPRAVRRRMHWGDRDFRKFNAIKGTVVHTVEAGQSGGNLLVKMRNGNANWADYLDTATDVANAASDGSVVTKYRAPHDGGQYQPGHQMHHRAWETPDYTTTDTVAAFKNTYQHARTRVGLTLASTALVASLHAGPTQS